MLGGVRNRRTTARGPVAEWLWRRSPWLLAALLIAFLTWLWWPDVVSAAFYECIHERKNYSGYHQLREEHLLPILVNVRIRLHTSCALHVANGYRDALSALSGIAVAAFTATLWFATTGLLKATEREFVSAHPPKIIVRRVSLDEGSGSVASGISRPWKIQYVVANTGLGRAILYEGNATVVVFKGGLPAIPPFDDGGDILGPIALASGESSTEVVYLDGNTEAKSAITARSWDQAMGTEDATGGTLTPNCIYFLGYFQYVDDIEIKRRMAFCRLYDFRTKRFIAVSDPDYEYN